MGAHYTQQNMVITYTFSLIMRKTSDKIQLREISAKYVARTPQNHQGHQEQGMSKKRLQPRGA